VPRPRTDPVRVDLMLEERADHARRLLEERRSAFVERLRRTEAAMAEASTAALADGALRTRARAGLTPAQVARMERERRRGRRARAERLGVPGL